MLTSREGAMSTRTDTTIQSQSTNFLSDYGRSEIAAAIHSATPFAPPLRPPEIASILGEIGAWGVNLHDNDLVPIDATPSERDKIVRDFRNACNESGIVVPMATVSLFFHPVFRDGAFTANDPEVRAYALQKTMRAMDLGAELGAKIFVLWGGREGVETDACRRADEAVKRLREAVNYLCEYNIACKYGYKFALEAKPNEPRGDIYMATTGHYLGFIPTLDHPEMVGVNPEVAHEQMAGLNFMHGVAQAWEAGKLFHIDLNDQAPGRYDQDLRFGSANPKSAFWLVKFLEDVAYDGPRHFDAHAYRTENCEGVQDFARGCMRTYLILKEKADSLERRSRNPGDPQGDLGALARNARKRPLLGQGLEGAALSRLRQRRDLEKAPTVRNARPVDGGSPPGRSLTEEREK